MRDSFYDNELGDQELGFYEKKHSNLIEGFNLVEKQQEEHDYHILKAIGLFTKRIQLG